MLHELYKVFFIGEKRALPAGVFWDKVCGVRLCSRTALTEFKLDGEVHQDTGVKAGLWGRQSKANRAGLN